jgi:hypothetical protein
MSEVSTDGRGADPISDYLAVMTGTAPIGTIDEADAARVRDGIQVLTATNASSKAARKLNRSAACVRFVRVLAWIAIVVAAAWIVGNVYGYLTETPEERDPIVTALVFGPFSAAAWALGFVAAIVLVVLRRRRKVAWY